MGAIAPLATAARPLIATSTAAPGISLQTTASAHGTRLINSGTKGAAPTSTGTTSFAAPTITPGLVNATNTATPAMPTPVMVAAGSEHLPPPPGASERAYRRLLPQLLQDRGDHPVVQLAQHSKAQRPQRMGRADDHGRGPVHTKRSCAYRSLFGGKIAATVVFLLISPPSKIIGGDKSYNKMSGKHVDLFFLRTTGTRPHGGRQAHPRQLRGTPDLLIAYTRNSNFDLIGFSDASYSTGNPKKAESISRRMPFSLGGHPLQRSHPLRQQEGFAPSRAGQLQQSKQTPRDP